MSSESVAALIFSFFGKKSTAIGFQGLLILGGLYLIFFQDSPYGLLFQIPVVVVGIIANTFWIMELTERDQEK